LMRPPLSNGAPSVALFFFGLSLPSALGSRT
jgi:hypothetical protein